MRYLDAYADASRTWLHEAAEVTDTASLQPVEVAQQIAHALRG